MADEVNIDNLDLDRDNLWTEETFTDLRVGSIRRLNPVKADGSPDPERRPIYIGQTQLMSQMGPVPVQAEIEADTLEQALDGFAAAMNEAVSNLIEEAKELRRREASRIVHPSEIQGPGPKIIE